jgi:hypothetical protein
LRATLPASNAIALERTRALDDTDGATRQTVEKMCELIRQSVCAHSPAIVAGVPTCNKCGKIWQHSGQANLNALAHENDPVFRAAAYARDRFAMGSTDPAALAWGCFWYVKHCVKFRLDEGTMLQIGESHDAYGQQQQDLLIAPAVLVRMRNPSEDCDGFTMLTAALLTCLGVPVLIATVATDMDDPTRWSHVFLCAIINGRVKPLDTSHGTAPGWMVPRQRINRWQTWTLDGRPADVSIPTFQGLHAYQTFPGLGAPGAARGRRVLRTPLMLVPKRGRGFGRYHRGMGQDDGDDYTDTGDEIDYSGIDLTALAGQDVISSITDANGNTVIPLPPGTTGADAAQSVSVAQAFGMCVDPSTMGNTACPSGATPGSVVAPVACSSGYYLSGGSCVINPSAPPPTCTLSGTSSSGTYSCPSSVPNSVSPNWGAIASQAVSTAGADVRAAIQQPANLLQAQTWANLVAYLPMIGIAVLGVVVITSFAGKK